MGRGVTVTSVTTAHVTVTLVISEYVMHEKRFKVWLASLWYSILIAALLITLNVVYLVIVDAVVK